MKPYQFFDRKGNLYQTRANLQRSIAMVIFGLLLFILPFLPFIREMHSRTLQIIPVVGGVLILAFAYGFYRQVIKIDREHQLLIAKKTPFSPFRAYSLTDFHHIETSALMGDLSGYTVRVYFVQRGETIIVNLQSFARNNVKEMDLFVNELTELLKI